MSIKISNKFLAVNGKRAGINISGPGNWVDGVDPATIKLRCKKGIFPAEIRDALTIENNSDMREDYFESDCIRLLPGHPLYAAALKAAA